MPKVTELGSRAGLSDFRVKVVIVGLHGLSWARILGGFCSFLLWSFTHTLWGGLPLNPDLLLREVVSRFVKIAAGGTWFQEASYSVSYSFMSSLCLVHKKKALCVCGMAVEC